MKKLLLPVVISGLYNPAISFADSEIDLLKERVAELEKGSSSASWSDRVELSGLIELEAYKANGGSTDGSDINLATVELGIDTEINNHIAARILLLHEEGEDQDVVVDEGFLQFSCGDSAWGAIVGKQYVPFGNLESHFIIDPLTLEIAETQDTAITLTYENRGLYGAVYLMNGDINEAGKDDEIEQYGASVGFSVENDALLFDIGLGYASNIGEADTLSGAFTSGEVKDYVAGFAIHANVVMGDISVFAEYVTATEEFDITDMVFDGGEAEPSAYNIEVAYAIAEWTAALGIQGSDESLAAGLDEQRIIVGASSEVYEKTLFGIELMRSSDYGSGDGGSGEDATTLTVQLAVEF